MFNRPLFAFLNHLLSQQRWARTRLEEHVGQVAIVRCGPGTLRFRVETGGSLSNVEPGVAADVELTLPSAALGDLLGGKLSDLSRHIEISGNARFAETLSLLLHYLRPDVGATLSPVLGNALAHRTERTLAGTLTHAADLFNRGQAGLIEYLREERQGGPLGEPEFQTFRRELVELVLQLDKLEKHLDKY